MMKEGKEAFIVMTFYHFLPGVNFDIDYINPSNLQSLPIFTLG